MIASANHQLYQIALSRANADRITRPLFQPRVTDKNRSDRSHCGVPFEAGKSQSSNLPRGIFLFALFGFAQCPTWVGNTRQKADVIDHSEFMG